MTSATKLRQKKKEHYAEAKKLNTLATAETTAPDLVADLIEKVDAAMKLGDEMEADCVAAEEREARINRLNQLITDGDKPEVNLDTKPEDKPKVTIPATARRFEATHFSRDVKIDGMDAEHRAYAFGRYLLATAARTLPGKYSQHANLIQKHEDSFGPMNAATEGGNAGIWVPDQFGTDLIILMKRYGIARNVLNVLSMNSDKRTDPKEGSDPTPTFVGEGIEGTDVTPTDDSTVTLTARKLMAILINSSELNEDAIGEFGNSMIRRMANGFAKKEDDCAFLGDGTSTYGQMKGIRTRLFDVYGAAGGVGLILGAGNAFSELTITNFEDTIAALPDFAESAEDNAMWICHRAFYYQVMVRLEFAQGGSPGVEVRDGFRTPLFMGWPVTFSNSYPGTASNSAVVCTFGNHRLCGNFGDRRMYSVAFSDQATVGSVNLWSSDQVGIKATERFDVAIHSVGDSTDAGPVVGLVMAAS